MESKTLYRVDYKTREGSGDLQGWYTDLSIDLESAKLTYNRIKSNPNNLDVKLYKLITTFEEIIIE